MLNYKDFIKADKLGLTSLVNEYKRLARFESEVLEVLGSNVMDAPPMYQESLDEIAKKLGVLDKLPVKQPVKPETTKDEKCFQGEVEIFCFVKQDNKLNQCDYAVTVGSGENKKQKKGVDRKLEEVGATLKIIADTLDQISNLPKIDITIKNLFIHKSVMENLSIWRKRGWKSRTKEDIEHKELWMRIYRHMALKRIKWHLDSKATGAGLQACQRMLNIPKKGA